MEIYISYLQNKEIISFTKFRCYNHLSVAYYIDSGICRLCESDDVSNEIHHNYVDHIVNSDPVGIVNSDPVGIVNWGVVLFVNLKIWHMWGSTIFGSRRLVKGNIIPICHQWDLSVIYAVVLHMHTFKEFYQSKSRYKYYSSR